MTSNVLGVWATSHNFDLTHFPSFSVSAIVAYLLKNTLKLDEPVFLAQIIFDAFGNGVQLFLACTSSNIPSE